MLSRRRRKFLILPVLTAAAYYLAPSIRNAFFPHVAKTKQVAPEQLLSNYTIPLGATKQNPLQALLKLHRYRADGLLTVHPDGPHPIYELVKRSQDAWNVKLSKASKTLDEAVQEYKRRYHRPPPLGFDEWWAYVQTNNVLLPDEYDQIYHDLEPFYGLSPTDIRAVQAKLEDKWDSYTLGKTSSTPLAVVKTSFTPGSNRNAFLSGAKSIIDMLKDIDHLLPPFRAVFAPHDGPNRLSDFIIKDAALKAAAAGTHVDLQSLPPFSDLGWLSACPPSSPARQNKIDLDTPPPMPTQKSFIYNHHTAMDPCQHPTLFHHHGQFLSYETGYAPQRTLVPEFSYCTTTLHHDIRFPYPHGWVDDLPPEHNPPWDARTDERLLWRGSNTGIFHGHHTRWKAAHRDRLVALAGARNGTLRLLPGHRGPLERVGADVDMSAARANPALLDIAFAGMPIMCDDEVCEEMKEVFTWTERQSIAEAGNYRYVLDIDGNGWSSRFKRLITSNALIFKATIYDEWYSDRVMPWVHYVPVQVDFSDLYDTLVFFRGSDITRDGAHEDMAREIAGAGREWSRTFWRQEDMTAYMYRLLLEYVRVMSEDRDAMAYREEV